MNNLYTVLMAGGVGLRFWPLGRKALPKQFMDLPQCDFAGENSMLRQTARRLKHLISRENILVAAGSEYGSLVRQQLPWLAVQNLLREEKNLDTAFAMVCALAEISERCDDAIVVFIPCDHHIADAEKFIEDLRLAVELASGGSLVTLGVLPNRPATEYGYMQGLGLADDKWQTGKCFLEKPSALKAAALLKEKNMFWNCGIFVGRAEVFAEKIIDSLKGLYGFAQGDAKQSTTASLHKVAEFILENNLKLSFDKLVMENLEAEQFAIVKADFGWDDLGTFGALSKYWRQDSGNSVNGCTLASDKSSGNIVYREGGLVALLGVDDLLVVESDGVLLIMPKEENGSLKQMVRSLPERGLSEYL